MPVRMTKHGRDFRPNLLTLALDSPHHERATSLAYARRRDEHPLADRPEASDYTKVRRVDEVAKICKPSNGRAFLVVGHHATGTSGAGVKDVG